MREENKRLNRNLMWCCNIIVAALLIVCVIVLMGEEHSIAFVLMFAVLFAVLIMLCIVFVLYRRLTRRNEKNLEEIQKDKELLHQMSMQTTATIVNLIEAKDEYTKGHSKRVGDYSAAIAKKMGYDDETVEQIRYVGLLHDIGKVGVPDSILNRPHNLSDAEYEIMKSHVTKGAKILREQRNMGEGMADGILYHHEHYDGGGYPEGLKGEQIPVIARIISVADAYDAMTTNRVYRKRLSDGQVREELRKSAGVQFDPKVVRIFCDMLDCGELRQPSSDYVPRNTQRVGKKDKELLESVLELKEEKKDTGEQLDYVTGAYHRKKGEDKLAELVEASEGKAALALLECSNAQEINKTYGFVIGDRILKTISECISSHNPYNVLVRYTGKRLIYYMPNVTTRDELEKELKDVLDIIKKELYEKYEMKDVKISIGASLLEHEETGYEQLLEQADKALYLISQLQSEGAYIYREEDEKKDFDIVYSKKDFYNLVQDITNYIEQGKEEVQYPELMKLYTYIKKTSMESNEENQFVMMTLMPTNEGNTQVEKRDKAVGILTNVLKSSLRETDVLVRFSSMQCLVFMTGITREQLKNVLNRLVSNFYRTYEEADMELSYEVTDFNRMKKR